ncbi:MAG: hypothetical protein HC836_23050 [Richelia sp. RM2_1_2]|nr:hypothetical protein [Richelia sp. RM2_1_2]
MPVSKCSNKKWRIGHGDCKFNSKEKAENAFKHWVKTKEGVEMDFNIEDTVSMDIPLLIRIFEYMHEDVKDDVEIHEIADRLISLSALGRVLNMDDYEQIVPAQDPEVKRIAELSGIHKY